MAELIEVELDRETAITVHHVLNSILCDSTKKIMDDDYTCPTKQFTETTLKAINEFNDELHEVF